MTEGWTQIFTYQGDLPIARVWFIRCAYGRSRFKFILITRRDFIYKASTSVCSSKLLATPQLEFFHRKFWFQLVSVFWLKSVTQKFLSSSSGCSLKEEKGEKRQKETILTDVCIMLLRTHI